MKKILIILLLSSLAYSQEKMNIAVMDLEGNGVSQSDLGGLSNRLRTELFKTYKFNVIERSRMDEILNEQGFQQTACTNTDCAIEVGRLIGVEMIIIGNVDYVGTIYSTDIRMVNVETGKIEKVATEDCEDCSINDVLKTTIQNVTVEMAGLSIRKRKEETVVKESNKRNTVQKKGRFENRYFAIIDGGVDKNLGVRGNKPPGAWIKIFYKKDMSKNGILLFDCFDDKKKIILTKHLFIPSNLATVQKIFKVKLPENTSSIGNFRYRHGVVTHLEYDKKK